MRHTFSIALGAIGFVACAPADSTNDPAVDPVTDAAVDPFADDIEAAASPLDDPGFSAAKGTLDSEERDTRDDDGLTIDERLKRDARDLDEEGCRRVAYTVMHWIDEHKYKGTFYALDGTAVADNVGYWAPIDERGGVFAGPWGMPTTDAEVERGGPMGGVYLASHQFTGTVTYLHRPFDIRGMWTRTSREGGIAFGIVSYCN
jgi:hypothetical protein